MERGTEDEHIQGWITGYADRTLEKKTERTKRT
jgi:hypothetical protein